MRLPIGTHVQWTCPSEMSRIGTAWENQVLFYLRAGRKCSGMIIGHAGSHLHISVDRPRGQRGQFVVHPIADIPNTMVQPFTGTLSRPRQLECDAWRKGHDDTEVYEDRRDEGYD